MKRLGILAGLAVFASSSYASNALAVPLPMATELPLDAAEWCLPQLVVTHGTAAEAVARVAAEWKADLIVVGAAGSHDDPLGASVPDLLRHAPCPVFVLPGSLGPSAARLPELAGAART